MKTCAGCGSGQTRIALGGVLLCAHCHPIVMERIEAARADGKPTDAAKEARALLRETSQDYILRDIPADLWQHAKHVAVDRGVSLRDLLLAALRDSVGGKD